jgi:hypothetical protein
MKTTISFTKFVVMITVLAALVLPPASVALAGSNGQQIQVYACNASRVVIKGPNQSGNTVSYTLSTSTSGCGTFAISGWYWKGSVSITPYYSVSSEYPYYGGQGFSVNVPISQSSNWYTVNVPTPSARQWVLWRAQTWVNDHVSYNTGSKHDGYRTDCSGYVSFAWQLPAPGPSTSGINTSSYSFKISYDSLQPGDALDNPSSHIVLFLGWVNQSKGTFNGYEENPFYSGAHLTQTITLNKSTGTMSVPGFPYPGTYIAIRKNGL